MLGSCRTNRRDDQLLPRVNKIDVLEMGICFGNANPSLSSAERRPCQAPQGITLPHTELICRTSAWRIERQSYPLANTNEIWVDDVWIEHGELTPLRPASQIALRQLPQGVAPLYAHTEDCSKGATLGRLT